MARRLWILSALFFLTLSIGLIRCSSPTSFILTGLGGLLPTLGECGDPENPCTTDGGTIFNPDGTPIADFTPVPNPTPVPTATPAPTETPTAVPTVDPSATPTPTPDPSHTPTPLPTSTPTPTPSPTPTPYLRVGDSCINSGIGTTAVANVTQSGTYTPILPGIQNYILSVSSQGVRATFDMSQAPDLERIILYHQGNSNYLFFNNAEMEIGVCNEMAGGKNFEVFYDSCAGQIADLQSGTGGANVLDLRFTPLWGLNYKLLGNNHCISATCETVPQVYSSNGNNHTVYVGPTCGLHCTDF